MTTEHRSFWPGLAPRKYGYTNNQPTVQAGTGSGYLLPWDVLDDEAERIVKKRPAMYVVIGEYVTDDGVRHPDIAVSDAYMKWAGFFRDGHRWKVPT